MALIKHNKNFSNKYSHFYGDKNPLKVDIYQNIVAMLNEACGEYQDKQAFIQMLPNGMSASLTYEVVRSLSDNFAIFLREKWKLKAGDRIAIQTPNCLAYPVVVLGAWKAGLIIVNINPLSTDREMVHKFEDAEISALVISDLFMDKLTRAKKKFKKLNRVLMVSLVDFYPLFKQKLVHFILKYIKKQIPSYKETTTSLPQALEWGKLYVQQEEQNATSLIDNYTKKLTKDDIALLQYTGGTTGKSKAAIVTHSNIMANVLQVKHFSKTFINEGEIVVLTSLPLYHIFAFTINLVFTFFMGGQNVLIPSPRPIGNLKRAFQKYSFTLITGVNTLFNALNQASWFKANPPTNVAVTIAGGMSLQRVVSNEWQQLCGKPIVEGYGLTEASPVVSFNPLGVIKSERIGVPMALTEMKCVNAKGKEVKIGAVGELIVKGPQVMRGYWRDEEGSKKTIKKKWLYTGDMAIKDAEGYFKIVDRKKDMINVSGLKVFSLEVEEVISELEDVLEVGVVGILDAKSGEVPIAYVVRKNQNLLEEDVKSYCQKHLTAYKVPKKVIFRSELPKTAVGKIHKLLLKKN